MKYTNIKETTNIKKIGLPVDIPPQLPNFMSCVMFLLLQAFYTCLLLLMVTMMKYGDSAHATPFLRSFCVSTLK